jgi:hypothetical protein
VQNLRSFGWQAMSPSAAALAGTPSLNGFGGVAQLGEHLLCKQGVIGSNPFTSTSLRSFGASAGRPASKSSPEASLFGPGHTDLVLVLGHCE